jgi:hypothetical protein
MTIYLNIPKWHIFIWSAKTLWKISNNVLFFAPAFFIFLSKPLECISVILKINLISLLIYLFYEKIQDSNIHSTKIGHLSY